MARAATVAARNAGRVRRAPAPRPGRRVKPPPRRGLRVVPRGGVAPAVLGAGLLDRLLRGRAWILCIGALLAGVVFLNVSLLEMNRGITHKAERAAALKRDNAELRRRVAELSSSERIQEVAAARGFLLPAPGQVRYLRAHRSTDARRAAKTISAPRVQAPSPQPQPTAPPPQPQPQSQTPATVPPAAAPQPQPVQTAPATPQQAPPAAGQAPPPAPAATPGAG